MKTNPGIATDLEQLETRIRGLLRELEHLQYGSYPEKDPEGAEAFERRREGERAEIGDILRSLLESLAVRMLVYSENLGLPLTHQLVQGWKQQWWGEKLALTRFWANSEADGIESPAFNELSNILDPLLVLSRPENAAPPDPTVRRGHEVLEHALRSLAKLCRDRSVVPTSERDVQQVLHSHLEGIFPDYARVITITKPLVSFVPDGGIPSLETAIECKFIASESELKQAIHGLTEDLSGYSGSAEWSRFYTVCYMTEAFAVEGQLVAALGASGNAGSWSTILVTGAGARRSRPRRTLVRQSRTSDDADDHVDEDGGSDSAISGLQLPSA